MQRRWTSVISRMRSWNQSIKKYEGRVVLRGDTAKDDSGSFAVCRVQSSSASQLTAAQVVDVIARLPHCEGQAADAVSACTQVKMDDAPNCSKFEKSQCPDVWIRLPRHKWPKSWSSIEDPVVSLERVCTYTQQFEEDLLEYG